MPWPEVRSDTVTAWHRESASRDCRGSGRSAVEPATPPRTPSRSQLVALEPIVILTGWGFAVLGIEIVSSPLSKLAVILPVSTC